MGGKHGLSTVLFVVSSHTVDVVEKKRTVELRGAGASLGLLIWLKELINA